MQTLREKLIDALETHTTTWPPACPPLEPTGYWGRGRLGAGWARITGLEARGGGDSREGTQVGSSWCLESEGDCFF